ncbi:MAG: hypothetical protein MZV70_45635 [Desulfobacterales bacterium]|nr:hypothetical protein [Desulfobacterales bacterium]
MYRGDRRRLIGSTMARIVRGQTLEPEAQGVHRGGRVPAASPDFNIIRRHIMPNTVGAGDRLRHADGAERDPRRVLHELPRHWACRSLTRAGAC